MHHKKIRGPEKGRSLKKKSVTGKCYYDHLGTNSVDAWCG